MQTILPEPLFHYTTASGMRGILESSRLWATNFRFLNDVSEVGYGAGLFEDLVQERQVGLQNEVVSEFLGRTLSTANGFDGMFDCYIACFCESDDLLNQWRVYAGAGGGYALGFRTKEIGRRWGQLERAQNFSLRKVIYDVDTQKKLLSEVIDKTINSLSAATAAVSVADANNLLPDVASLCATRLQTTLFHSSIPLSQLSKSGASATLFRRVKKIM